MVYKKPALTSRVYTLSIALSKYSLYPSRSQPCLLKPCPSVPKIINYHPNQSLWLLICANLCSSIMTPLFLHCISTPPLLNHWTYTGLTLEQHWTHHLPPPTHIPSHISHTLLPHLKALQRCSVAALHATFLNHRKHQYIFNYI